MPDDVKVLAASGDDTSAPPIATDLINGRHHQKVKFGWGSDGTWNETDNISGKRIPVADPSLSAATAVDCGNVANTDQAIAAAAAGTRFMGFSVRETTGTTPALLNFRRGTSNIDPIMVSITLGANESAREWYGPDGIAAAEGIWLERVTGTIQATGYMKVVS
jgi:hypothetical protein